MSNTYTQVFGGSAIYPSDVSYLSLDLNDNILLEWPLEATGGNNVVARIIDVATDGVYTITMPDATNVGVGQTVLFNNLGPDIVTVNNLVGNAILSMGAGEQWQIYLTDNATAGGQWRVFRYGAATAQAQASALAGPGLTALGSELAQNIEVVAFSVSPLTLTTADRAKAFVWTGALGLVGLPTIALAAAGWSVQIRNNGTGDLVIDPSGSETIDSAATLTLRPGDSAMLITNGFEWFTIGLGQQAVFAFDYTVIAVTGGTYTLSGSELNRIAYKFTGTLSSSVTVLVPAVVQQYWVNNDTAGPFALEIAAIGGGPAVTVPQGESNIYYCDGTNIVQATTTASFGGTLGVGQGGTGASTANDALTNLGGTGTGKAVFTAASGAAARSAISAAAAGANSDITSLSALSTPLSVGQGGTGSATPSVARSNLGAAASGSNSDITALTAAPGIQIGAPTGGAQGDGTLNATGLFINGVAVGTGSGSVTSVNASGGTTGMSFTGGPITTSGTLTLTGTLGVGNGGTGQTTFTNGQVLVGKTDGTLAKTTLTAGSGITITNGDGTVTIASATSGGTVTSVAASGGTTGLTFTGSPITTDGTLTLGGTLAVTNGGTGAATASGARLNLGAAASGSALTSGITMSTGRILGRTTAGAGALEEISVGAGLTLSGGTLTATGSGTVTSVAFSTGTTGLTVTGSPITTSGTLTLAGTLAVTNGGTGATTQAQARTNLGVPAAGLITSSGLLMNSARILGRTTAGASFIEEISIGSGLTLSGGTLSATGGGGTVTSVAMTVPAGFSVSGSPITSSGTLAITVSNAATARATLGATTVGSNLFTLANPSAVRFLRVNADNTVTALTAEAFKTALSANVTTTSDSVYAGNVAVSIPPPNSVILGAGALQNISVADGQNVAVGRGAGQAVLGGTGNVIVGDLAGAASSGTLNNCVVLGSGANPSAGTVSNQITLGNSSITTLRCQVTTITSLSDERDKDDVRPLEGSLDLIKAVEPVRFTWAMRDGGKAGVDDTGFTAQALQRAMAESGVHIPDLVFDDNPDRLEAGYGKLIPVLVGAIKELTARLEALEANG